jgi:hypothetical protein
VTPTERVLGKFDVDVVSGCWLWREYRDPEGYGRVRFDGKRRFAHRVVYELLVGPIPDGLVIDHRCRVRHCVNPDHLEPVTIAVNNRRLPARRPYRARSLYCGAGLHLLSPENTYTYPNGSRNCRTCARARQRERYARKRADA